MTFDSLPFAPAALLLGAALTLHASPASAAPRQPDGARLQRAIERLSVVGNVLYVAAHPDDENTRLLAWLANDRLVRAAYLSITRGDGGQNLIGAEQGPLLGLIRTQELLAARGVDGAEQLFTRARDFGYSKTPDETLAIWGKDPVLADVVFAIRRFRPDVIITRFPPTGGDTHGHHTASAMLALEAFKAAADPHFHPEQLKYAAPWQAKRILWNKGLFMAKPNEDLSGFLKMDVGGYNALLGTSWGEMAAQSRTMHKSQGFGSAPSRGTALEYFQTLAGEPAKASILDGVDLGWTRVSGATKLADLLKQAREHFNPASPEKVIPLLFDARDELAKLADNPWKESKQRELEDVIAACAGLYSELAAAEPTTSPGAELAITVTSINRSPATVRLKEIRLPGKTLAVDKPLAADQPLATEDKYLVPAGTALSNPYWLDQPPGAGLYTVEDPALIGVPEQPPALTAELVYAFGDRSLSVYRPFIFKWTDPVAGERVRPVEVAPPVTLDVGSAVRVFPDAKTRDLNLRLHAQASSIQGTIELELPAGWKADPASMPFTLAARGADAELVFHLHPPAAGATPTSGTLRVAAVVDGKRHDRGLSRIDHPHIPIQTLLPRSEIKLVRFDLKRAGSRIGYIVGAGDEVPAALRQAGYEVTLLSDEALVSAPLDHYDAIVVGVRAYNTNPRLPAHHQRLMDYVARGGTLLVQYSTSNRISKAPPEIGPHPFDISQERVTDENAAVTADPPGHAALTRPNRLTDADWSGWIQERGLYFAGKWSEKYETPLSMHDPGEPARKGGLLVARHGKGRFVYTGLAFFRQLPAGVPGAFRLFANLLAHAD